MTDNFIACKCDDCQDMCRTRPCWGTPTDIEAIIKAGQGGRLMNDYWVGNFNDDEEDHSDTQIVSPAIRGHEGGGAPWWPHGRCAFLTEDGLCELHDLGLKPTEGKAALCQGRTPSGIHEEIARAWDSPAGRKIYLLWLDGDRAV